MTDIQHTVVGLTREAHVRFPVVSACIYEEVDGAKQLSDVVDYCFVDVIMTQKVAGELAETLGYAHSGRLNAALRAYEKGTGEPSPEDRRKKSVQSDPKEGA